MAITRTSLQGTGNPNGFTFSYSTNCFADNLRLERTEVYDDHSIKAIHYVDSSSDQEYPAKVIVRRSLQRNGLTTISITHSFYVMVANDVSGEVEYEYQEAVLLIKTATKIFKDGQNLLESVLSLVQLGFLNWNGTAYDPNGNLYVASNIGVTDCLTDPETAVWSDLT